MKHILIAAVRGYQRYISPALPRQCRFYPTCSQYCIEALHKYGACKGTWLTIKRLLRCQPLCPGGFDPIP